MITVSAYDSWLLYWFSGLSEISKGRQKSIDKSDWFGFISECCDAGLSLFRSPKLIFGFPKLYFGAGPVISNGTFFLNLKRLYIDRF